MCLIATWGWWLPCWIVQLHNISRISESFIMQCCSKDLSALPHPPQEADSPISWASHLTALLLQPPGAPGLPTILPFQRWLWLQQLLLLSIKLGMSTCIRTAIPHSGRTRPQFLDSNPLANHISMENLLCPDAVLVMGRTSSPCPHRADNPMGEIDNKQVDR